VVAVATSKSVSDPQWQDDPEYKDWLAFMRKYYPDGDVSDQFALDGYGNAVLFAEVLRRCGDDLTRDHLMQVVTHLNGLRTPMLLLGITLNTSPTDYHPIKQMRLQRFDSHKWDLFGDLIEE
jgi:branched-chain amino acid transport system substrate-binding protein